MLNLATENSNNNNDEDIINFLPIPYTEQDYALD